MEKQYYQTSEIIQCDFKQKMPKQIQKMSKSTNTIVTQGKACPIQLHIDYHNNQVLFNWDCSKVKCQQGFFFRYILIIDIRSYSNVEQIYFIIESFYKRLKLGDFMKVLFTNNQFKMDWIEKTAEKISKQLFVTDLQKIPSNIIKTFERAIKILSKFQQPANISVFTRHLHKWNQETILKSIDLKNNKQFCYTFCIFYETKNQGNFRYISMLLGLQYYEYSSRDQLDQKFRVFFFEQTKMRVYSAQIKLSCINGDIFLRNENKFFWYLENGSLCKNIYGLYNNMKYQCALNLNSYQIEKVGFQIQFIITMLNMSKYLMREIFYIAVENTAQTIEEVKQLMVVPFKCNHYSQMPNSIKVLSSPVEKIVIRQKICPESYLTYQRQFFNNQ